MLPTIAEAGYPGFEVGGWLGLLAPATPPAPIIARLHRETVRALKDKGLRSRFTELGMEAVGNTPAEFAEDIKTGIPKWAKIIKDTGISRN